RASPLAPEERRAAIIEAVLPLLVDHGDAVTTRQLAQAAGVSEGTIFNVFADKDELLSAALEAALDPAPFEEALAKIDSETSFDRRLVEATRLIQRRTVDIWRLLSRLGAKHHRPPRPMPDSPGLVALFESEPERVRLAPREAARLLRALTLALTHPS